MACVHGDLATPDVGNRLADAVADTPVGWCMSDQLVRLTLDPSPVELARLAIEAVSRLSPHTPVLPELLARLRGKREDLVASRTRLARLILHDGWLAPINRDAQVRTIRNQNPGTVDFDLRQADVLTKPRRALWTSTVVEPETSWWALYAEDSQHYRDSACVRVEPVSVSPEARVYEICCRRAWSALCAHYPLSGPEGRVDPDWRLVAGDWDGAWLSPAGLLDSHLATTPCLDGWSRLDAWDCESTVWLRPTF